MKIADLAKTIKQMAWDYQTEIVTALEPNPTAQNIEDARVALEDFVNEVEAIADSIHSMKK